MIEEMSELYSSFNAFHGFIIFVVLGIIGFIAYKKIKSKQQPGVSAAPVLPPEPAIATQPLPPRPVQAVYKCTCGAEFIDDLRGFKKHLLDEGRKEKGKHRSAGKIEREKSVAPGPISGIIVNPEQSYRVLVRRFPKFGGEPIIRFSRINKPLGNVFWAEPSLPESGQTYYVKENEDGTFEPYDPRQVPIISVETPQRAYRATHFDRADGVWLFGTSFWGEISKVLVWVVLAACILIVIISLGG